MSDQSPPTSADPVASAIEKDSSRYDWAVTPPSLAVLETVADIAGQSPTSLPPLYEAIDPD